MEHLYQQVLCCCSSCSSVAETGVLPRPQLTLEGPVVGENSKRGRAMTVPNLNANMLTTAVGMT